MLDYYGHNDALELGSSNFRLAIGGRGGIYWYGPPATDEEFCHEPRYVRWVARNISPKNGVVENKAWLLHDCTEEDWA